MANVPVNDTLDGKVKITSPRWLLFLQSLVDGTDGQTVTIVTAKLTPSGSNGSQTFKKGILVEQTQAT